MFKLLLCEIVHKFDELVDIVFGGTIWLHMNIINEYYQLR